MDLRSRKETLSRSKRPPKANRNLDQQGARDSKGTRCLQGARRTGMCVENETLWKLPGPRTRMTRGTTVTAHITSRTPQDVKSVKD